MGKVMTKDIKILKNNSDFKTPVIVLTANALTGMKEEYINLGFDGYLSKPIDRKEMLKVLKKYLG